MQRQRDELVPVAEVLSDLGGPVAAIRAASPQALHTSPDSIRWTSLSRPAKRSRTLVSWYGRKVRGLYTKVDSVWNRATQGLSLLAPP